VDERDWLTCNDPDKMLRLLGENRQLSRRKVRLFAVACCRQIWRLLSHPPSQQAVEVSEQYAEGSVTAAKLRKAERGASAVASDLEFEAALMMRLPAYAAKDAALAAAEVARTRLFPERVAATARAAVTATPQAPKDQGALLRDIFGNPFRRLPSIDPAVLAWQDGTVVRLAQAAYEEREMPSGHLDRQLLAVLADALEEAGCTEQEVLGHLRGPGVHVRGCWVIDFLTGRK